MESETFRILHSFV
jgi:hypothetical protein